MEKQRVGIIFGGKSTEHEVSLQSAKNIITAIDKNLFEFELLEIDKQGQWHISNTNLLNQDNFGHMLSYPTNVVVATVPGKIHKQLINADNAQPLSQIDVLFPIVHGTFGEDGSLQGMLRILNLPFVGSNVLTSAICMDKDITKRLLRDAGLHVAPFITLTQTKYNKFTFLEISEKMGLPFFVKPANQGSSIGINKVNTQAQFEKSIRFAFEFDHKVLVEQRIIGREIACAVLGNNFPEASICGEIILNNDFYSYDNKYINHKEAKLLIPATLDAKINEKIREISLKVYSILGCSGMARIDVFLTKENKIIVNEINTLPGFTKKSMYPKLWEASGLNYQDLITRLIDLAIEQHSSDNILNRSFNKILI